ncbi:MAG TPA: DUF971 domain-containing protein [Candidatus Kapabacteria bacterium]|nr:DUF971 domain-containing protein [Candidatus Kapabacteria bacterium]
MRPTQIKRDNERNALVITWDDGHTSFFPITFLRDECPCAGCKGETILGTHYPAPLKIFKEGMYKLARLETVGQYAVQAYWKDGHDTGIYSWEYLLMLEAMLAEKAST